MLAISIICIDIQKMWKLKLNNRDIFSDIFFVGPIHWLFHYFSFHKAFEVLFIRFYIARAFVAYFRFTCARYSAHDVST